MKRARNWWWWGLIALPLILGLGGTSIRLGQSLIEFRPPHSFRPARARLSPSLKQQLAQASAGVSPTTTRALIDFALDRSGRLLHFGLAHQTRLVFDTKEREGNCVEYSALFATIFAEAAARHGSRATVHVVRSDARIGGIKLPGRGLDEHDWVLVVDRDAEGAELRRYYVDAAFADSGLGWDISENVEGELRP
jgi:hypothetical protein